MPSLLALLSGDENICVILLLPSDLLFFFASCSVAAVADTAVAADAVALMVALRSSSNVGHDRGGIFGGWAGRFLAIAVSEIFFGFVATIGRTAGANGVTNFASRGFPGGTGGASLVRGLTAGFDDAAFLGFGDAGTAAFFGFGATGAGTDILAALGAGLPTGLRFNVTPNGCPAPATGAPMSAFLSFNFFSEDARLMSLNGLFNTAAGPFATRVLIAFASPASGLNPAGPFKPCVTGFGGIIGECGASSFFGDTSSTSSAGADAAAAAVSFSCCLWPAAVSAP